jgi:hypothetical protein
MFGDLSGMAGLTGQTVAVLGVAWIAHSGHRVFPVEYSAYEKKTHQVNHPSLFFCKPLWGE